MIRKLTALLTALMLLASLAVSCGKDGGSGFKPESFEFTLREETEEMGFEDGYSFIILDDGTVKISEADVSGDISIPEELAGKRVSEIGDGAFFGNTSITSVEIPDTVEAIGLYAFSDCTSLVSVKIGKRVWRIAPFSFDKTPWFASLTDEFVTVGDGVLIAYNGTSRTPTLPDGIRHIGGAFTGNEEIRTLTLCRGVLSISEMALSYCTNLVGIDFGLSLAYVGEQAFAGSERLTSLVFPDTLTFLGSQACYNCYGLKYVYLGQSLTELGDNAFEYSQALRAVYVPKTLKELKSSDFTDCMSFSLILYGGSEEEFDAIARNDDTSNFKNINKVFNHSGGANE